MSNELRLGMTPPAVAPASTQAAPGGSVGPSTSAQTISTPAAEAIPQLSPLQVTLQTTGDAIGDLLSRWFTAARGFAMFKIALGVGLLGLGVTASFYSASGSTSGSFASASPNAIEAICSLLALVFLVCANLQANRERNAEAKFWLGILLDPNTPEDVRKAALQRIR